ncbi:forkhead box protein R1 [Centroberyx affinis]|uniref:forkhead box protein R1 n=1 Tax=Centroberyx affinis TaxID=166261 RepID=UPI003A5C4BA5
MSLQFKARCRFLELHCCTGLTDWDMDEEMKLTTTTDQFHQDDKLNDQYLVQWHYARISRRKDEYLCPNQKPDSFVQPNLWLMVNPNLACPIQYGKKAANLQTVCKAAVEVQTPRLQPAEPRPPRSEPRPPRSEPRPPRSEPRMSAMLVPHAAPVLAEQLLSASSTEHKFRDEDGASRMDFPAYRQTQSRRKGRSSRARDSKSLKPGGWPRPPVNYCILIAMALSSSHTGSLNVQQIYNFTREHFPFFQTAPDGWKNTIRHNLCFSNSFRKTPHQLCREGKRKSCLWHLTPDGRRRLRDEIRTLTGESFKELKRSMSRPDMIQTLFAL